MTEIQRGQQRLGDAPLEKFVAVSALSRAGAEVVKLRELHNSKAASVPLSSASVVLF